MKITRKCREMTIGNNKIEMAITEKAKAISTKTIRFEATKNQYWIKSVRGKAWELWDETEMLKRVARIPVERVYWVEL